MFDWFDEPMVYYRRFAPMRSGVFDYMSRWMDSVDRAMEDEFGEFFDPFFNHVEPRRAIASKEEKKQIKKEEEKEEPKEEEKKKEDEEEEEPHYYSFNSSMYTDSHGVQHMYREETDSKTGKKKVVETRRIGNKSLTLHRVTDKDGNVEEHETRKNLRNDDEVEQFKKDWMSHNNNKQPKAQLPAPENDDE